MPTRVCFIASAELLSNESVVNFLEVQGVLPRSRDLGQKGLIRPAVNCGDLSVDHSAAPHLRTLLELRVRLRKGDQDHA